MGHLESMTQLLQEERDFYKRECELLRNMKEKSVLMSPPTRERVMNKRLLITAKFTLALFTLSSKTKQENKTPYIPAYIDLFDALLLIALISIRDFTEIFLCVFCYQRKVIKSSLNVSCFFSLLHFAKSHVIGYFKIKFTC